MFDKYRYAGERRAITRASGLRKRVSQIERMGRPPMPKVHASTYNKEKFRELIVYLAKKSEADPRLGAMKWNKLMFFADREAYGRLGHSISGARYHKIEHGPAAAALVPVRDEMLDSG